MASLRVMTGPSAGRTISITDEVVVGRENVELAIEDDELSRRHAVVRRRDRGLEVEDLGSANGTFVDGVRIDGPTAVSGGALLKFGTTEMVVEGVLPPPRVQVDSDIADPQMTRIADPEVTAVRGIPTDLTRAQPIQPVSEETRARPIAPLADATQVRPIQPAGQPAQARPIEPAGQPTQARPIPSAGQPTQARPVRPPGGSPAAPPPSTPVGTVNPLSRSRTAGPPRRLLVPVALILILVAIGLVIYLALR